MVYWGLKSALVSRYGSQTLAARHAGFSESRLSRIIHGHDTPRPEELRLLRRIVGKEAIKDLCASDNGLSKESTSEPGVRFAKQSRVVEILQKQTGSLYIDPTAPKKLPKK